jgi:hypothetical protein
MTSARAGASLRAAGSSASHGRGPRPCGGTSASPRPSLRTLDRRGRGARTTGTSTSARPRPQRRGPWGGPAERGGVRRGRLVGASTAPAPYASKIPSPPRIASGRRTHTDGAQSPGPCPTPDRDPEGSTRTRDVLRHPTARPRKHAADPGGGGLAPAEMGATGRTRLATRRRYSPEFRAEFG